MPPWRSPILNEKFAAREYRRRPVEHEFILPRDGLRAPGTAYPHRRFCSSAMNGGCRRCRRTGTRRLRFTDATFAEADLYLVLVDHAHQFDVRALRKVGMHRSFARPLLPAGFELADEDHEVRVAHGNRDAGENAVPQADRLLAADFRSSHRSAKFKGVVYTRDQLAGLYPGVGANHNGIAFVLGAEPGRDAAGAVAGNFGIGSVGVNQANGEVGVGSGQHPLDPVGADSVVTVADAPGECGDVLGSVLEVNNQKVVAAGGRFYKGYGVHVSVTST